MKFWPFPLKTKLLPVIGCLLALVMLVGCNDSTADQNVDNAADNKIEVIAVNFPAYDCARRIGGDMIDLTMLLKPGAEAHSFEPTAQNMVAISQCDLFIYGGGESDVWVDGLLDSVDNPQMMEIRMMDCTEVLQEELKEGMTEVDDGHDDHADHTEAEYDEHVWTDPLNMVKIADAVSLALQQVDPANAGYYATNLDAYTAELQQLDDDIRQVVERSAHKTLVFGDRFPFRYFVERYDMEYWAAFPGCSGQTEPSAATLAFLIDKVRELELPVVLKIELSNDNIARIIADEANVEVRTLYACHNVSLEDFEAGETYLSLMRRNLETLKEALL